MEVAAPLTERELVVLRLLPTRLSTREIGRELSVSVHTVRSQIQAVYRKLQASTRSEAVAHARELGLLPGVDGHRSVAIAPPMHPANQ
jgi:LuxR family maltose regulon positive regulatory protein